MRHPFFYVLFFVLIVLDAWLLSHPNLIGQVGVFFFDYTAIETFPKALGTVSAVAGAALFITWVVARFGRSLAIMISVALLAVSAFYMFQSFRQYNTGIYKLTGSGFRAGAILLPGLVVLVFGRGLFEGIQTKLARR